MVRTRTHFFVLSFFQLFLLYTVGLFLFLCSRIYFILKYGNFSEFEGRASEVVSAFFIGYRTDTMSIAYALLPLFFLILIVFLIPSSRVEKYAAFVRKTLLYYSTIVFSIFFLILVADFFFYRFFNDHLNILVFALFEDDTRAVLTSVWTDYPVIKITGLFLLCLVLLVWIIQRILRIQVKPYQWGLTTSGLFVAFSLVVVFTAVRNSWGMFPFRIQNTVVSDNVFINQIGIGGVYSLQNAFKEKNESTINTDISETLARYRFNSLEEATEVYLNTKLKGMLLEDQLKGITPRNEFLEAKKPHVIVIQMESMSNNLLDFHTPDFNLLGELEDVIDSAYVFRNFVSATPTTINSLEALLVGSPETPLSQSIYQDRKLATSAALVYKNAGYHTSFVTGSGLAWRNLDGYLSTISFSDLDGNAAIKKSIPAATDGEWGTYDEFMFDHMFRKLQKANSPQFMYAMTTSNHTPFDMPESYKGYPLKMPEHVSSKLKAEQHIAMKNFLTYQYANDCLGKFVKRIQASEFKDNTIILAVGDHSISQLLNLSESQLLNRVSVPCILFVPEKYRPKHEVDVQRFGSHKDVFPTLYNLTLSKTPYIRSGNNLLAAPSDSTYFFGVYKYNIGFSKDGCVLTKEKLSFTWSNESYTWFVPAKTDGTNLLELKTRAYSATMSAFIKSELLKGEE